MRSGGSALGAGRLHWSVRGGYFQTENKDDLVGTISLNLTRDYKLQAKQKEGRIVYSLAPLSGDAQIGAIFAVHERATARPCAVFVGEAAYLPLQLRLRKAGYLGFMGYLRTTCARAITAGLLVVSLPTGWAQTAPQTKAGSPETLTLTQAIARATANEPVFALAAAEQRAAALDRKIARTALLPTATYRNLALYTKPNGVPTSRIGQTTNASAPAFIANNAIREYTSQGVFDEKLGLAQVGAIRLADANAARLQAELEIARRGLVSTVVSLFYGADAGAGKVAIAEQALQQANSFVKITEQRETAREGAHADVLKAQLQQQQRQRDLLDAQVAAEKARTELAVLLFPDPSTPFLLSVDEFPTLGDRASIQGLATQNNPELRSAFASVQSSQAESYTARTALLPELALNFTYGIDATNFGVNGPDGIRNLGYSMSAQLDIPVWDWLATERRIKQARIREGAAAVALTAAGRRLLANISEYYAEADAAGRQLTSLHTSVITAAESLRLTTLRFIDGESTALEVVDAQSSVTSSENAEIDGRIRYELALTNLQTLTGKL